MGDVFFYVSSFFLLACEFSFFVDVAGEFSAYFLESETEFSDNFGVVGECFFCF